MIFQARERLQISSDERKIGDRTRDGRAHRHDLLWFRPQTSGRGLRHHSYTIPDSLRLGGQVNGFAVLRLRSGPAGDSGRPRRLSALRRPEEALPTRQTGQEALQGRPAGPSHSSSRLGLCRVRRWPCRGAGLLQGSGGGPGGRSAPRPGPAGGWPEYRTSTRSRAVSTRR